MGGRLQHAEAREEHESKHVEGAGAWPEYPVVETDEWNHAKAENERCHPLVTVGIIEVRLDGEEDGDRNEQEGNGCRQPFRRHQRGQACADGAADHRHNRHRHLAFQIDMAASCVGDGCRGGAELRLQLVRG